MEIPEGINCSKEARKAKVCKLLRALYGLNLSPKRWYEKFTETAFKLDFRPHKSEPCIFIWSDGKHFIFLILYSDDMLIVSNFSNKLKRIVISLKNTFKMTYLGEPRIFLEMEITRDKKNKVLTLSLVNYISKMIE